MGFRAPVISEGSPRSGEQGSPPHVQGWSPARRVEAPSHHGGVDLGVIQDGGGEFIRPPATPTAHYVSPWRLRMIHP